MKNLISSILNILYPPLCVVCDASVSNTHSFCINCFNNIEFISDPICEICGIPFEYHSFKDALCLKCIREKPLFYKARSAVIYNEQSKSLVTRLKFSDRGDLAIIGANLIYINANKYLSEADIIIATPLHWRKMIWRKYNQSILLAQEVAKLANVEFIPDILRKIRHTKNQTDLSRKNRLKNLDGAFTIRKKYISYIKNKNIVIIDDVISTNSTANICAKELILNGANKIFIFTVARRILEN